MPKILHPYWCYLWIIQKTTKIPIEELLSWFFVSLSERKEKKTWFFCLRIGIYLFLDWFFFVSPEWYLNSISTKFSFSCFRIVFSTNLTQKSKNKFVLSDCHLPTISTVSFCFKFWCLWNAIWPSLQPDQ